MPEPDTLSRPIQVFLDTGQFITLPEPRQRGGNRDFFDGDNRGFSRHKLAMRRSIQDASATLRRERHKAGFLIVQMREEALAKSYRPVNALFSRAHSFHLVGGGEIGEIFFQCTPDALGRLDRRIEARAEPEPQMAENRRTGRLEPRPSAYRSELGGIDEIRLPVSADRVSFSAREAVEWLSRPDTLGAYVVELFRPDTTNHADVNAMIEGFRERLARLGGVVALPLLPPEVGRSVRGHLALSVHLTSEFERSWISLPFGGLRQDEEVRPDIALRADSRDVPVERHQQFLEQMAVGPLVRRISLPPSLGIAPLEQFEAPHSAELPGPPEHGGPVVGIIDGGVADIPQLAPWRAGGTDPIDPVDRDLSHGTFIAGLVAGARALNPDIEVGLEPDGCGYFDIPLMPRLELVPSYYAMPSDFFDQLEEEVVRAKADAGVRVFNLSLGDPNMRRGLGYSVFAQALDYIAAEHDVLFVVSAGNLGVTEARAPWPSDGDDAVRLLARRTAAEERIIAPAEHLLGVSVGALNPPGIPGHDSGLPTTYTRRGPGVGGARKPDLSHYGGVSPRGGNRTGLCSFGGNSAVVDGSGTSFAAPLVATTVATIDHRLQGAVSRETLIALLVHRSQRCAAKLMRLAKKWGSACKWHVWGTICVCPQKESPDQGRHAHCKGAKERGPVFGQATVATCARCPYAVHTERFESAARAALAEQEAVATGLSEGTLLKHFISSKCEDLKKHLNAVNGCRRRASNCDAATGSPSRAAFCHGRVRPR